MATPTSNSIGVTSINTASLSHDVQALVGGTKWGGGLGAGVTLTYSFPGAGGASAYTVNPYTNYSSTNEWASWTSLTSTQQGVAQAALSVWSQSANVGFSLVADNQSTVGEIRFGITDQGNTSGKYAHAYLPGSSVTAGDVWMSRHWATDAASGAAPGTYAFTAMLHELGHALGLKHPFEGAVTLDAVHDNYLYSIMSYNVKQGGAVSSISADFYPTTPQYLDLLAIETLYGQSHSANPGNTTYTFNGTQHYWQTINDYSGTDTIVYNSTTGGRIDLSNAHFSQLGVPVHFSDGTTLSDTIALGPHTVIENATGGSGNDVLTGNDIKNVLKGGNGNDTLAGGLLADTLNGGLGADTFVYGKPKDSTGKAYDTIAGFDSTADHLDVAGTIKTIDHAIAKGALSLATFDVNMAKLLAGAHLAGHSAVLVTPNKGDLAHHTFLVVNSAGTAGYLTGHQLVIQLTSPADIAHLDKHDFV